MSGHKQTQYVLVCDTGDGLFCIGIYNNFENAVAEMMYNVWEDQESYKDEESEFFTGQLLNRGDGGGFVLEVKFKDRCWKDYRRFWYHILTCEQSSESSES